MASNLALAYEASLDLSAQDLRNLSARRATRTVAAPVIDAADDVIEIELSAVEMLALLEEGALPKK